MSSKRQIKIAIARLNKTLWHEQNQLDGHKRYLQTLFQHSWLMLPAFLLPAFMAGWSSGRMPVKKLKHFGRFVLLSMASHAKKL